MTVAKMGQLVSAKEKRAIQKLEAELKATRLRLEEAEETLRAIRNNEVDALVIDGPQGQQVFTLEGAEQPYRTLMETMAEGSLTVTIDGTILYCNQRFAEMLKTPLNKIIGSSFQEIMSSEGWRTFKGLLDASEKKGCRGEYYLTTSEGQEIPVVASARALQLRDGESFCIVVTDLTEQRTLEQKIRQSQKMEALGTLTAGVAHEFNNILAAVIGFTELARDRLKEGSREVEHLDRVFAAGLRGRELVKQMLMFSRKTPQEKKPLRLSSVINETIKILRPSTPATIAIRVNIKKESGMILADSSQIQQVLMNLATNAAYAMRRKGGTLYIELDDFSVPPDVVDPHGIKPGNFILLRVRDTGVGMTESVRTRIFDPFFTTKEQGEGTGLGLSVTHGIVEESGGYVMVESRPGEGTTFSLYFPMIPEKEWIEDITAKAIVTGHERILFIDDEEPLAYIGQEMLTELGYQVVSGTSAREALGIISRDPSRFDLLITDQTMRDMTGMELAKEVLAIRPDIPVILCTGFSHMANEESAKAQGIKGFVMKPLTKREIAEAIRKALDG
jgi:PAS domain S-box-containing protein